MSDMPATPWTYGDVLRALRDRKGWTQKQVGEAVGVSSLAVSKWELNAQNCSTSHRIALAELFRIDPGELGVIGLPETADTQARLKRIEAMLERLVEDCENKPNGDANGHAAAR